MSGEELPQEIKDAISLLVLNGFSVFRGDLVPISAQGVYDTGVLIQQRDTTLGVMRKLAQEVVGHVTIRERESDKREGKTVVRAQLVIVKPDVKKPETVQ